MRYLVALVVTLLIPFHAAYALLNLELTRGVSGAVPIAIVPFQVSGEVPQPVATIISNDLEHSGRFRVSNPSADQSRELSGIDSVVKGKVVALGGDRYEVSFQMLDAYRAKNLKQPGASDQQGIVLHATYTVNGRQLRQAAHQISDQIYQKILGVRGVFSTRLAYVVIKHTPGQANRYSLEVADADGYSPRVMLTSTDPIMSPSWAPNGRELAYVSFENRRSSIYIQNIVTGGRRLVSSLPGINGAPSWSPDGKKLALVLSKDESPNIYVLDIGSRHLTQITHDFYINTEPAWSPDHKFLIFTSTRSGGPQIYQYNFASRAISRITYDGNYNARGGFTADGRCVVTIHKDGDAFNIALFDLNTGAMRLLTPSGTHDSSSPSVAPNGSMVLYDTVYQGQNMLAMVSTDGHVQLRLPARDGEAQDPAWSPFMS